MKWLYRAAALLVLLRIESTLTEIVQRLAVLRELALHPLVKFPPDEFLDPSLPNHVLSMRRAAISKGLVSPSGEPLAPLLQSFNVSPGATDPGPGITGPTAATGRSDQASGVTGEVSASHVHLNSQLDSTKTVSPTSATEQEVGSPGPAREYSATGPEHNHDIRLTCNSLCPAYYRVQREKIAASGHAVICIPSLAYPHNNCDLHPHVAGEAL